MGLAVSAGLASAAVGVLWARIVPYTVTNHGGNPLTVEGALNVTWLQPHFVRAVAAVDGRVNSGFRSQRVNKLVGGSPTSLHMQGRAIDIGVRDPVAAGMRLYELAIGGQLGPVRDVIIEPTWVHVDWHSLTSQSTIVRLRRINPDAPAGAPRFPVQKQGHRR